MRKKEPFLIFQRSLKPYWNTHALQATHEGISMNSEKGIREEEDEEEWEEEEPEEDW